MKIIVDDQSRGLVLKELDGDGGRAVLQHADGSTEGQWFTAYVQMDPSETLVLLAYRKRLSWWSRVKKWMMGL